MWLLAAALVLDDGVDPSVIRATLPDAQIVSVAAHGSADEARAQCEKANSAALAFDDGGALRGYERAMELYLRALPFLPSLEPVSACLLDQALHALDAKQLALAKTSVRRALVLSPGLRPSKSRYHPAFQQLFAKELDALERLPRGSLTIEGEPAGGDVWIDGRPVGVLPASIADLTPGEHWLLVKAPGRTPFSSRVQIAQRAAEKVSVFLPEKQAASEPERIAGLLFSQKDPDASVAREVKAYAAGRDLLFVHQGASGVVHRVVRERIGPRLVTKTFDPSVLVGEEQPTPAPAPVVVTTSATERSRIHPAIAMLPFGIGQFASKRPLAGALWLTSQALLLGLNLTFTAIAWSNHVSGTQFQNPELVRASSYVINISFGVLIADIIAGGIEGVLRR